MAEQGEPRWVLNAAAVFEAGLAALAFGLGWLLDVDPLSAWHATASAVLWGALAALPPFALFLIAMAAPARPLREIREVLLESLGPSLARCRWYDLAALAAIAGISEEILFRGVLQPWIAQWGIVAGLLGSNLLFGLAHAVTPTYALVAGGMGLYMGWLLGMGEEANLVRPIVTHAVYDWLAFLALVRIYRNSQEPGATAEPALENDAGSLGDG